MAFKTWNTTYDTVAQRFITLAQEKSYAGENYIFDFKNLAKILKEMYKEIHRLQDKIKNLEKK